MKVIFGFGFFMLQIFAEKHVEVEDIGLGDEGGPWSWTQEEQDLPENQYALDEIDKILEDYRKQEEDPAYALEKKKERFARRMEIKQQIVELQEAAVPRGSYHEEEKLVYFDEWFNDAQYYH